MKLELKHLSGYLPYGLKIFKDGWGRTFKMDTDGTTLNCVGIDFVIHKQAKPILRPLSDLAKEIEINEEKIIPINVLLDFECGNNFSKGFVDAESGHFEWWTSLKNQQKSFVFGYNQDFGFYMLNQFDEKQFVNNQLLLFQKLFEWHFDVFGLIPNDLAISIHDVSQ